MSGETLYAVVLVSQCPHEEISVVTATRKGGWSWGGPHYRSEWAVFRTQKEAQVVAQEVRDWFEGQRAKYGPECEVPSVRTQRVRCMNRDAALRGEEAGE